MVGGIFKKSMRSSMRTVTAAWAYWSSIYKMGVKDIRTYQGVWNKVIRGGSCATRDGWV